MSVKKDRISALSLATDAQDRKKTDDNPEGKNVGGLNFEKEVGSSYGELAARLLLDRDGTFIWDRDHPTNGIASFNNIHQYAAAEIYAPGGNLRARIEASQEFESAARFGFNSLANWMVDVYGAPLFRLNEPGSGNKITVITVHPDYEDPHTGKTAATMLKQRDRKQVEGQVFAARKRLSRQFSQTEVAKILRSAVETSLKVVVDQPRLIK